MMVEAVATQYADRGWSPVPVKHGGKVPWDITQNKIMDDWSEREIDVPTYFSKELLNIGIRLGVPSKDLVDIDLDCDETVRLAATFLPTNTLMFGRPGAPNSHYLFYADIITKKFQAPEMLVEMRSTGTQTVFPPSIHVSGEAISFTNPKVQPLRVGANTLRTAVSKLASAALLSRNWPGQGGRQDATLALAGGLFRAGWSLEDAKHFILAILHDTGDEEISSRLKAVEATHQKVENDQKVTGWPSLSEAIGEQVVNKVTDWLEIKEREVAPLADYVLSVNEIMALDLPQRETFIDPFITASSLTLIAATRGLGKTWCALSMGVSLARGERFMLWDVPGARRVLYIDGEMPLSDIAQRLKGLCGSDIPELLHVLPSELLWLQSEPLVINQLEHQFRIAELLDAMEAKGELPDVVILDNQSSLTAGMDENSNSELDQLLHWLIALRHRGLAVILIHHVGKSGTQRGASRREDLLDTSIMLEPPKRDDGELEPLGAAFNFTFTKTRGEKPNPGKLYCELIQDEAGRLTWGFTEEATAPKFLIPLRHIRDDDPKTNKEIAEAMEVSVQAIGQSLKKCADRELVTVDEKGRATRVLTEKGLRWVDRYWPRWPDGEEQF